MKEKLTLISYDLKREMLQERIEELIRGHESFEIVDVKSCKQGTVVDIVKRTIEANGLKCRIRTSGRGFVAAALAIPTLGGSLAAFGAIGIHNLATRNPDYEVIKKLIGSDVRVVYFKDRSFIGGVTGEL